PINGELHFVSMFKSSDRYGRLTSIARRRYGELPLSQNAKTRSCELPQKPHIVLHEKADIGNIEQNHREPIHSETECVAAPFLRIVSLVAARLIYRFEHRRMYHARTGNFNPLLPALKRF